MIRSSLFSYSMRTHKSTTIPAFVSSFYPGYNTLFTQPNRYVSRRPRIYTNYPLCTNKLFASAALSSSAHQQETNLTRVTDNQLNQQSEPQPLLSYIKEKASKKAVRKIHEAITTTEAGESIWSNANQQVDAAIYRTAIRELIRASRIDLASEIYQLRAEASQKRPHDINPDFPLAVTVLKATLREARKRNVKAQMRELILAETERSTQAILTDKDSEKRQANRVFGPLLKLAAILIEENQIDDANRMVKCAWRLSSIQAGSTTDVQDYNNLIRLFGKQRALDNVFSILDMIYKNNVSPNNETYEFLGNAAIKQVEFVTGAVSPSTLPEPINLEVAFVGRSNVGKSSLVNMICNRKALAYVSGRPGKTQQFNYFLVNGRDPDSKFYLVDLPGVGYAKVPTEIQQSWMRFMWQYMKYRKELRLIFHLVDGRHGALKDDEHLMRTISTVEGDFAYVIVLTKMDKMDKQKAKRSVLDKTRAALKRNGCREDIPIVLTSANSKLGREEMWRYLKQALSSLNPKRKDKAA